jgi:hypothetical protein
VKSESGLAPKRLQSHSLFGPPTWFYNQVRNHGPWDYKQRGEQYQDFGNFNYGATGTAAGYPPFILKRFAGWAQIEAGNPDPSFGRPWGSAPYGDDPNDQAQIDKGIDYVQSGCAGSASSDSGGAGAW